MTWIQTWIDRHGTGRVMFRNRRAAIGGFPVRIKHLQRIRGDRGRTRPKDDSNCLLLEFDADVGTPGRIEPDEIDYQRDPRLDWLLALLEQHRACQAAAAVPLAAPRCRRMEEALRTAFSGLSSPASTKT
jgi:ATP-dependent helicase HepA